jgi:hypothetical protein
LQCLIDRSRATVHAKPVIGQGRAPSNIVVVNYVPGIAFRQARRGAARFAAARQPTLARVDEPAGGRRIRSPTRRPLRGGPFSAQLLEWHAASIQCRKTRRMTMKNPLDSIWGTIISGLVLTAILYLVVKNFLM